MSTSYILYDMEKGTASRQRRDLVVPDESSGMQPMRGASADDFKRSRKSQWTDKYPVETSEFPPGHHISQADHSHFHLFSASPKPLCMIPPLFSPDDAILPAAGSVTQNQLPNLQSDVPGNRTKMPAYLKLRKSHGSSDQGSSRTRTSGNTSQCQTSFINTTYPDLNRGIVDKGFTLSVPQIGHLRYCTEEGSEEAHMLIAGGKQVMVKQKLVCNKIVPHSGVEVGLPDQLSSEDNSPNARNRLRRAKISEGIRSLKESVPSSGKGSKEAALDDVIDYVKFLKFQVKALSQARLGGEATFHGLVHIEGFGHYLEDQQELSEPLEEAIEQLMKSNMPAAIQFLERKGLAVLPMSLADTLFQAS